MYRVCSSILGVLILLPHVAQGAIISQYADSVIGVSSQWSATSWSAAQALGAPDTFSYGDIPTAWAPRPNNGTLEFITVGFTTPVYANEVTVRETYGNGFVYQIDVLDLSNVLHTVWSGVDTSLPGSPVDFVVNFAATSFLVKGVKVYTDTNHNLSAWEEIDSITLVGDDTRAAGVVPEPYSLAVWSVLGLVASCCCWWRRSS